MMLRHCHFGLLGFLSSGLELVPFDPLDEDCPKLLWALVEGMACSPSPTTVDEPLRGVRGRNKGDGKWLWGL